MVALLAGCATGDAVPGPSGRADVVVGSFDFAESRLLGELYAQALEDEGVDVDRALGLGPRELVLPALRGGQVDVVPEYAGAALEAIDPGTDASGRSVAETVGALRERARDLRLTALHPSRAEDVDVVAVTAATARRHDLRRTSDLRALGPIVLGGPPECGRRPRCRAGLEDRYGLEVRDFVPLTAGAEVSAALADGVIDAGILFSTDPVLADRDLVALEDDRGLQPRQAVLPLVRRAALADPRVARALDEVSGQLTTEGLRFLGWRLTQEGATVEHEAHAWLVRHGLVDR